MIFDQAKLEVKDPKDFELAKEVLEKTFGPSNIAGYLASVKKSRLRVRNFEGALSQGLMGKEIAAAYEKLGPSDRGQVREIYLTKVEKIAPELRSKYLKLFAYY